MIWEDLTQYTERKKLSQKGVKEAVEILANGQYSTDDDIARLDTVLLKLDSDVVYLFFTDGRVAAAEDTLERIVKTIDVENSVKAGHIAAAAVALEKAGNRPQASSLLMRFVQTNLPKKLENKSLYEGFHRAMKYGSDSYLFAKLEDWGDLEINLYTRFLVSCAGYLNDSEFGQATEIFCRNNGKNFVWNGGGSAEKKVQKTDEGGHKVAKPSEKAARALDLGELLKLLESKVTAIQAENKSKNEEIRSLNSEKSDLKNTNANLISEVEKLRAQNGDLIEKESDLERKVSKLTGELREVQNALEHNQAKLNNVESAFGQAGQTEIDALKGNIRKRLSSEYEKYTEIKEKKPDLGYYEILLGILEDVFRVLKKNGIAL